MSNKNAVPGTNGNLYVPYEKRTSEKSVVYFTRDLSPEGLKKIYDRVSKGIEGKVAIKLHTGEAEGPNIIPRPWVKELYADRLPEGGGKAMIERVETRHGLRQLSYMKELGMGNDLYTIIDIDNGDAEIAAQDITKGIEPVWTPDKFNTFPGRNKLRK